MPTAAQKLSRIGRRCREALVNGVSSLACERYVERHVEPFKAAFHTALRSDICATRWSMVPASGLLSVLPLRTVYGYRGKCCLNLQLTTTAPTSTICLARRTILGPDASGCQTDSNRFRERSPHRFSVSKQLHASSCKQRSSVC